MAPFFNQGPVDVKVPDKNELARQEYFNQPDGFPFEEFRLEDVNLPPEVVSKIEAEDDGEAVAQDVAATQETGFGSSVAVDGLPVTTAEKYEKLQAMVKRKFEAHGKIRDGCFWMPQDEKGGSKGFAFIEYSNAQEAAKACREMDKHAFDKNHTLRVLPVDELDRLRTVPDAYVQPERAPFDEQSHSGTMAWMTDKRGRDQFLIQHQNEFTVCWNDAKKGCAEPYFSRSFWSDGPMSWSPHGMYAATLHQQGVALWVSKADGTFHRVARFACPGVQKVDFSAGEELLTCYSVQQHKSGPPDVLMTVFDVRSGRKLRTLADALPNLLVGRMDVNRHSIVEPFLRWSPTAPPLATKLAADAVQVYAGSDMTLLGKKSIVLEGVQDACWSPVSNILAVYQTEHGNLPARVSLLSLPDRTELRQKNLFAVASATLCWHPQGDYLAVHVDKFTKSKKSTFSTIELFTLKSKGDVTNDVFELANKNDKVLQVAWEPRGHRFAVIHAEGQGRVNVSFFSMRDKTVKEGAKLLGTITGRTITSCHWSPAGRVVLLAALDSNAGTLEFFNVDDMATLRTQAHFLCNNVRWDQTGRCVCSWVDDARDMEHGYVMWSFTGEMLYRCRYDSFWDFAWRPRPPSQLPAEVERDIHKNLKTYAKRYDEQDEQLLAAADTEQMQRRGQKRHEWQSFLASKEAWVAAQLAAHTAFLGHAPVVPASSLASVDVQQVIDVREEPYLG